MVSDEEILKLWRDPTFPGSYRGVRTFQVLLKTDLNIDIPENRLLEILKKDSIYLIHQRPKRKFDRRSYFVHFYGQLVQIDIAYMFPDTTTKDKYFILAIDVFSFKIFVEPLKDKSSDEVLRALKLIFDNFKHSIYELQSDRGKEFRNQKIRLFLKSKNSFIKFKFGKNKASVAEYGILLVKRKLYMTLRAQLSNDWCSYIQEVVKGPNNTPLKKLGWKTPNSIHDEADSVAVQRAQKLNNISTVELPSYKKQEENQKSYKGDLKIGDYVYVDFNEQLFDKSFDVSVRKKIEVFMFYKEAQIKVRNIFWLAFNLSK